MASRQHTRPQQSTRSTSSAGSCGSADTHGSTSTAPTSYSHHRPVVKQYHRARLPWGNKYNDEPQKNRTNPRLSVDTYASTTASIEEAEEREEEKHVSHVEHAADVIPSTPAEFAELFPSTRRMLVRHDTTIDGTMNLRVDTEVGPMLRMTLFHLRMQDLRERKFSLRRYCRDSGREVCTSNKKYMRPKRVEQHQRPTLQRSFSSALYSLGAKAFPTHLKRSFSVHGSDEGHEGDDLRFFTSDQRATVPTNIIKLEFSNYAHVEVARQRTRIDTRWAFDYWGNSYHWSRAKHSTSYHLVDSLTGKSTAHITPEVLSKRETESENSKGSWCSPCAMVINDKNISDQRKADLADVIVATGLITLVDDSIRRLAQ